MKELSEIRKDIDAIDQQIVELYEKRMELTTQVADYKISTGKQVFDAARELQKLAAVEELAHSEFTRQGVHELFEHIMTMSRKKQYQLLTEHGMVYETGFTAAEDDVSATKAAVLSSAEAISAHIPKEVSVLTCETFPEMAELIRQDPDIVGFLEVGMEWYYGNVLGYYNEIANHDLTIIRSFEVEGDETKRCLLISNNRIAVKDADTLSMCFEAPDSCGSLYHLLSHLTYNDLNLNRIGSVVINTDPLDYRFFIDVSGNINDPAIQNAVRGLSQEARNFRILGNYKTR